ncbi:MAG: porin [Thermodesulfobacteriota bacterium]
MISIYRRLLQASIILAFLVSISLWDARAEDDIERLQEQLQGVLERLDRVESENARLREQVEELNRWLKEKEGAEPQPAPHQKPRHTPAKPGSTDGTLTDTPQVDDIAREATSDSEPEGDKKPGPEFGLHPGGGGFFLRGEDYHFRLLGYVQVVGSVFDDSLDRGDGMGDFSIRRARLDFLATLFEKWEIFIEIDGGPGTANAGDSDFALVEARLNWQIVGKALQLRVGKYVMPFSEENSRSSRDFDTVERYLALNSMFLLPALDVQFGGMVHGALGKGDWIKYFLGVYNGNGRANSNFSDNNSDKEILAKLKFKIYEGLTAGVAFDYSKEREQTLSLSDLGFDRYVSVTIEGKRIGIGGDIFWRRGPYSFRAEGLVFYFDSPQGDDVGLLGGFVQPAYFIFGDSLGGLQLLFRTELAHLDADTGTDGDTLWAFTAGINWFVNPNVRLQVDGIYHYFDGPSSILGFGDSRWVPMLLTELQYKF